MNKMFITITIFITTAGVIFYDAGGVSVRITLGSIAALAGVYLLISNSKYISYSNEATSDTGEAITARRVTTSTTAMLTDYAAIATIFSGTILFGSAIDTMF